jgi:glycosyltransferase involved in cell wall biosynthesis
LTSDAEALPRILYITPEFPKTRHGFEATELSALRDRCHVEVFSLRRPSREAAVWLRSGFPELLALPIVVANAWLVLPAVAAAVARRPRRFLAAVLPLVRLARADRVGATKACVSALLGCAVARTVERGRFGWIHADFASAPATAAMVASALTDVPWSFCGHAFDVFSTKPAGAATVPLLALKSERAAVVFAENTACAAVLAPLLSDEESRRKVVIKRNGVGKSRTAAPRASRSESFVVLGLGALDPKKGFDVLIAAAARLRERGVDATVEIHGEGPERATLESLAKELDVPLLLPGFYTHEQLPGLLARADVVAMPARRLADGDSDGVPTVLMEALMYGRPVVSTDAGSIGDLIQDGETGLMVRSDDPDALAAALERVRDDPKSAERMARAGGELVAREFTAERAVEILLAEVNRRP